MRANLRETPFGRAVEPVVDRARDRELEDAVAEELQALVRVGAIVGPGGVREDLPELLGRELRDKATELERPGGPGGFSPDGR